LQERSNFCYTTKNELPGIWGKVGKGRLVWPTNVLVLIYGATHYFAKFHQNQLINLGYDRKTERQTEVITLSTFLTEVTLRTIFTENIHYEYYSNNTKSRPRQ